MLKHSVYICFRHRSHFTDYSNILKSISKAQVYTLIPWPIWSISQLSLALVAAVCHISEIHLDTTDQLQRNIWRFCFILENTSLEMLSSISQSHWKYNLFSLYIYISLFFLRYSQKYIESGRIIRNNSYFRIL